jgi:hypothetical protein
MVEKPIPPNTTFQVVFATQFTTDVEGVNIVMMVGFVH